MEGGESEESFLLRNAVDDAVSCSFDNAESNFW